MGMFTLANVRLFAGGADLTGAGNKLDVATELEDKDVTTFASVDAANRVWKEVVAGLASTEISGGGLWAAGDPGQVDDAQWSSLGAVGALTACPAGAAVGAPAWVTKALGGKYAIGGSVGDVAPWEASWGGAWPMARGLVLHPPGTARTATGSGTAVQLGAVPTGRALYVCLHVLSVAGSAAPTITVRVESDDNAGFTSATTRAAFTAATAQGGQALVLAGPITDDYWRVAWTISGTTPSFLFAAAAGIQ